MDNVITNSVSLRKVRWYSDYEYKKMYPEEADNHTNDPYYKTQKVVLGFINDFITIFKNNNYENSDYFRSKGARYTKWWGWFFASDAEIPEDLPEGVIPVRLDWSLVGTSDEKLKSDKEVADVVDSLIYDDGESEYQGEIGEKSNGFLLLKKQLRSMVFMELAQCILCGMMMVIAMSGLLPQKAGNRRQNIILLVL